MDYRSGPARVAGMGLLETSSPIGLCAIDDGAGGAAGGGAAAAAAAIGGAADVLGGEGGQGAAGGEGGAAAAAAAAAAAGGEGGQGGEAEAEWLAQFSAEGGSAENPSNRDWLKAKGFKTVDDLAKSYREAEHAIRNGGKFNVPGAEAKPEEIAAYHKAIGVPEKAEDYTIALPEGVKEDELDLELLGSLKADALKSGMPAKAFEGLAGAFIEKQLNALQASATAENSARDELFKEWGAQKDAKMADVNSAMRGLGLSRADVAALQRGFAVQYGEPGSRRTLELLAKLGAGMAEDVLRNPDASARKFGVTPEQAQAEIDKLIADADFGKKLLAKDPEAVARWNRLNGAVAAGRDAEERRAAAA